MPTPVITPDRLQRWNETVVAGDEIEYRLGGTFLKGVVTRAAFVSPHTRQPVVPLLKIGLIPLAWCRFPGEEPEPAPE